MARWNSEVLFIFQKENKFILSSMFGYIKRTYFSNEISEEKLL